MAKKQKQKKTGMLKRQQQKRRKKMVQRRKTMPRRSPQAVNSPQQLEQLLGLLPKLAFEPELADLRMDGEQLRKLLDSEQTEAEVLMALLTDEFLAELERRLVRLEAAHSRTSTQSMLAQATRHQLENSQEIPYLSNPVLVVIFLITRAEIEGNSLTVKDITAAMEAFDERNKEYLVQFGEKTSDSKFVAAGIDSEDADGEESGPYAVEKLPPAIDEEIYKKYIDTVPPEKFDRVEEDLEMFLVDFRPPPVAEWEAGLLKRFIDEWFLENANPLEEDLQSMRETLLHLFAFLAEENLLPDNFFAEVSPHLQGR